MALFSLGARINEEEEEEKELEEQPLPAYSWEDMESFEALNIGRAGIIEVETKIIESNVTTESVKTDSDVESESSTTTSYMGMLSSLIWNTPVERKASYICGVDSWVPNNPEEIIEIPESQISYYKKVYPLTDEGPSKNGWFIVITDANTQVNMPQPESTSDLLINENLKEPTAVPIDLDTPTNNPNSFSNLEQLCFQTKPPLHHLVVIYRNGHKDKRHVLSLYRNRKVTDAIALCERCRECADLFKICPKNMRKEDYLPELLSMMKKNVLWKSAHIAAAMGIIEYFEPATEETRNSLEVYCQPEGMTPLLIAVQNNRVDLVTQILALSPELSAVDVNKNTVLHLAAGSSEEMIRILMDTGKCDDFLHAPNLNGSSALYLAVTAGNGYCAKALRSYGASFTAIPGISNQNPLLDIMKKNKLDIPAMKAILEAHPQSLEEVDPVTGNGILHSAPYKKPLLALLQLKANDLELEARNLQGQTALHAYVQRNDLSLVIALVAFDVDLDAKDSNGNTALHIAVSNNNIEIVHLLLCLGAKTNLRNNHNETPRHLAAKQKDDETAQEILRSLIICGARSCSKGFPGCTIGCVHKDNFVAEPKIPMLSSSLSSSTSSLASKISAPDQEQIVKETVDPEAPTAMYEFELDPDSQDVNRAYKQPNPVRSFPQQGAINSVLEKLKNFAKLKKTSNVISVLALDGGGIKGLVIVQILLALEKYLDEPLINYFDWIAGTSTGSYVSGAITTGSSLRATQKKYLRFKDALFDSWSRPYSAEVLEGFLQEMFGENTTLADVEYPRLFFTTVRADTFPVQMEFLRNYRLPITKEQNDELGFEDPAEMKLWRASRRSSAAPTYFPSSEGKFLDGGMVSNNPTLDLLTEACFWNSVCQFADPNSSYTVDIGCVVSIGTGITPIVPIDPSLVEMANMFGMIRGLKNLSSMVLDTALATEGAPIARSRTWCHSLGIPYFRLNAPLSKAVMLDTKDDSELVKMMWDTMVYSYTHRKDFQELASLLKSIGTNHQRRKTAAALIAPC